VPLTVAVAGGPTGTVFNIAGAGFAVPGGASSRFLFAPHGAFADGDEGRPAKTRTRSAEDTPSPTAIPAQNGRRCTGNRRRGVGGGGGKCRFFLACLGGPIGSECASPHVLATRKATKRIVSEAERLGCDVIVMGGDPPRNRFVGDFIWSQEPYRVQRRAGLPVYVVTEDV